MSEIRVNKLIDEAGTGAVELTQGATIPTGKTLSGAGSISIGGDITATGNISVGGTLTYDDVTNIDSVGLVTARSGVNITGGDLTLPDAIIHSGDTNTKIRFPGSNQISFETGGAERFRINNILDHLTF